MPNPHLYFTHKSLAMMVTIWMVSFAVHAQPFIKLNPPTIVADQNLRNPYAGGIDAAQLGFIDLTDDGVQDLIIYDRSGDSWMVFENSGISNPDEAYTLRGDLVKVLPDVDQWMVVRDFDGDGLEDIFSHTFDGGGDHIKVWKGKKSNGVVSFQPFETSGPGGGNTLYYLSGGSTPTNIRVSRADYPAFVDEDGDGDTDILTFSVGGGSLEFYRNVSVEQGFGKDSLLFFLADNCWGKFYEGGLSNMIVTSDDPNICALDRSASGNIEARHAGSTVAAIDMDGDDDLEIVLGDISFGNLTQLVNGGSPGAAWINQVDDNFPSTGNPVEIDIFPGTFFYDINNDGLEDMVAARNNSHGLNQDNVWLYLNGGSVNAHRFSLGSKSWLTDEMIDLGTEAHPCFIDVNADGLLDIVVGNNSIMADNQSRRSRLVLFMNEGTMHSPTYRLVDEDYLSFSDQDGFSCAKIRVESDCWRHRCGRRY